MKAFITSIGESTTELCVWSLERQGFEVVLLQDTSTLWDKLEQIFQQVDEDFLRVDADVIVNRNIKELVQQKDLWWYQSLTFGWFSQDVTHGGIQFIRKQAIEPIKKHIYEATTKERPETYLSRLQEFHDPRRFGSFEKICGINGYKQNDIERVKETKQRRNQLHLYDFELAERMDGLI